MELTEFQIEYMKGMTIFQVAQTLAKWFPKKLQ